MTVAAVLLHGRGGAPEDMHDIVNRLGLPSLRWRAPGAPGGQWYPHRFTGPVEANEPFLTQALEMCKTALEDVCEEAGCGRERAVIIGFSQGACLASEFVLRYPAWCRALVMFTGGLIGPETRAGRPGGGTSPMLPLAGLQALVTGSDADEWVPEARVRLTAQVLADLGADVDLRIYAGRPHVVGDDEIEAARALLTRVGSD